jgi:aldehyde dehydrogenase (NAD+)
MTGTRIAREEIFGPVLSVRAVSDLDDAMARLNDTAYSLSASIYVRDVHSAFSGIQELDTGIV